MHVYTYIHTYVCTCIHIDAHVYTHIHIYISIHFHKYIHIHTRSLSLSLSLSHTHTHTHAHLYRWACLASAVALLARSSATTLVLTALRWWRHESQLQSLRRARSCASSLASGRVRASSAAFYRWCHATRSRCRHRRLLQRGRGKAARYPFYYTKA